MDAWLTVAKILHAYAYKDSFSQLEQTKLKAMKFCKWQWVAIVLVLACFTTSAQSRYQKLIWADEFDKPGTPDSSRWIFEIGNGCPQNCGWGNNELEYYTNRKENAVIKDGMLHIIAMKEKFDGREYTSARMISKGKFAFTYGRVEVRAKVPAPAGTWPAIWMLGSNIEKAGWPACGEIDIMEHRGRELNKIFGTLHYPGHSGDNADGKTTMIENASTAFHVYSVEWSPESIRIFVDGKNYHTVQNSSAIPFNHDFFLLLNVAVGGNFAGAVDPAFRKAAMEVDYVRVYQ